MASEEIWNDSFPEDDSDAQDSDISALLDSGYDQLDGFVAWLEETRAVGTRIAQQECFNAEAWIDYLANYQHKTAAEANEYDLRWFMFSHYIRKAMADAETEERLPDSLANFYAYLQSEYAFRVPAWLPGVLDDQTFFLQRRRAYAELDGDDERQWEEGFRAWCVELEEDLDVRALSLPRDLVDGLTWQDVKGWREATLWEEANRLWQKEREGLLGEGQDYEAMRESLDYTYRLWLQTPQDRLDGSTPVEVILEERENSQETEGAEEE